MKNLLLISLIGLFFIPLNKAYSQYVVEISVDQPPVLEANAGTDKSIEKDGSVEIGGDPSATGGYGEYSYSWSPGNTLSEDTIPNPTASPDEDTDYTLTVEEDSLKCTSTSEVTVKVTTTGFEEITEDNLKLYPVPATDVLHVKLPEEMEGRYKLQLVNLQGKILTEKSIDGSQTLRHRLRVKDIPSGAYFVKIFDDETRL